MSQTSFLDPHTPLSARFRFGRTGFWLTTILVAALVAAGTTALVASNPIGKSASSTPMAAIERHANPPVSSQPPLALPGFQRRGPLLTGEVKTPDGSTIRLVIDTRSHAIIGYKLVDPAVTAENKPR